MSYTFTLEGRETSNLAADVFPAIELDGEWEICLVHLTTFNSIPNIVTGINDGITIGGVDLTVPEGSYEIESLEAAIQRQIHETKQINHAEFSLQANSSTLKSEIVCSLNVQFKPENSFRSLLGFESGFLENNKLYVSQKTVNILNVNIIRVLCNIVSNSFINGRPSRTLHEFYPQVPNGYKIHHVPSIPIYLPVSVRNFSRLEISLVDQNDQVVRFRDEEVSVRVHLRKRKIWE